MFKRLSRMTQHQNRRKLRLCALVAAPPQHAAPPQLEHITDGAALSLTLQQLHCQDLLHALQCGHVLHEMCLASYCQAAKTTIVGMRCPVCRFVNGGLDPDELLNPEAVWSSIVT